MSQDKAETKKTEVAPVENVINFSVKKGGGDKQLDQKQAVEQAQKEALEKGYNRVSLQNETDTEFVFLGYNR